MQTTHNVLELSHTFAQLCNIYIFNSKCKHLVAAPIWVFLFNLDMRRSFWFENRGKYISLALHMQNHASNGQEVKSGCVTP